VNVLARTAGVELVWWTRGARAANSPFIRPWGVGQGHARHAQSGQGPGHDRGSVPGAVEVGIAWPTRPGQGGVRCLGMGEMGIRQHHAVHGLVLRLLGFTPLEIAGPGAGLDPAGCAGRPRWWPGPVANDAAVSGGDPLDILAALGGLEIAGLTGLALGAAANRLPVVVDGFISTAAYVAAWKMHQDVADYAFFSHVSAEPGTRGSWRPWGPDRFWTWTCVWARARARPWPSSSCVAPRRYQ
jgi:nicotinate-nucleotide--dimethylbenzimidazole phosphoribosyltransferase